MRRGLAARAVDRTHWPDDKAFEGAQSLAAAPANFGFDAQPQLFAVHDAEVGLAVYPLDEIRHRVTAFVNGQAGDSFG